MKKVISSLLVLSLSLSLLVLPASALSLEDAKTLLAEHYVDEIPPEILEQDSLEAILEALGDPYTYYMTAEQYQAFNRSVNGDEVVGIGATVEVNFDNGFRVMSILPKSPALEAGIRAGDIVTAVDGTRLTAEMDPRAYITGEEGTSVTLTILRDGQELEFTLIRRRVDIPIVTYELVDGAAYIDCVSFGQSTAPTFQQAIQELDEDTAVWIVDLRSNPGGDATATSNAAGLFIGSAVMLYFRDGAGNYRYSFTLPGFPDLSDKPVIVLTSSHSASGSELFAGQIRSYEAGISIGQRTFGKGTAQTVLNEENCDLLKDGEALKVTAFRFFAPDGATNHVVGVLPTLLISPENTQRAALLLSAQEPPQYSAGYLRLHLADHTFYIHIRDALQDDASKAAFTELLEALPLSAILYEGFNFTQWREVTPAQAAEKYGLDFSPRTFSDAADSEFDWEINTLGIYQILTGEDGLFHPKDPITRAEFCAMAAAALNLPDGRSIPFPDVDTGAQYAGAISAMANMGFISGGSDGAFSPDAVITYQEMITILSKIAAWISMDGYYLDHKDMLIEEWGNYLDYDIWAQLPARNLNSLGALAGDLAPADPCTRELAAAMLCRLMERTHLIWD